ncbi:MAG: efflux RND transporter periplasmic adaptor subunit [Magnetococcales bacterium]|nr:efflux RND transporter periplasmic adaptor subunit [Magnetococcales bacterium]
MGPPFFKETSPAMNWKRWTIITLLVTTVSAGGWYYWRQYGSNEQNHLITAKVILGEIEETTTALGTLQPLNFVDVGAQVSGQLKKIHVDLGATVKEGELLAEIDPTLLAARVESNRAQIESLEAQRIEKKAQHALAKIQFERQKTMLAANATSQESYQSAESALKSANAQIVQITAQIRQVESSLRADEASLGYARILAPMNGTVVTLPARQGQTLIASQQAPILLRIADLTTMTVLTQVSEADISRLKLGMEAWFTTLGHPEKRHYGRLRQILPTPDVVNNVVLYNALFDVANPDGELGIQMSAQVSFVHASARDALMVPITALNTSTSKRKNGDKGDKGDKGERRESGERNKGKPQTTVRLMVDGKPENRVVEVGVKNRLQAQILSGLQEGDEVVIATAEKSTVSTTSPLGLGGSPKGGGKPKP